MRFRRSRTPPFAPFECNGASDVCASYYAPITQGSSLSLLRLRSRHELRGSPTRISAGAIVLLLTSGLWPSSSLAQIVTGPNAGRSNLPPVHSAHLEGIIGVKPDGNADDNRVDLVQSGPLSGYRPPRSARFNGTRAMCIAQDSAASRVR